MASKKALKRIINKDIKEIKSQNLNSLGIYIEFDESDMLQAKAMIVGPEDSLYEGGFLFFNIRFPSNYPFSPPDVSYVSRNKIRMHPNIYVGGHSNGQGKVCLSILGTWAGPKWTSIMDITTVLLTIQSLFDKNPLHHEPGQENNNTNVNKLYNEVIKYESIKTLTLKNFLDVPEDFEIFIEPMKENVKKYKPNILKTLSKNKSQKPKNINLSFYRISSKIDYPELEQKYINLLQEY